MRQTNFLLRVYFPGVTMNDTVTSIGSGDYSITTVLVKDLPNLNPQFYIEQNINGHLILCTMKTNKQPLDGVFVTTGIVRSVALQEIDFVGGRPDDAIRK